MVAAPALRETIILIIFGIVLVPIAAKRAQDAPGYWQTFSRELSSSLGPYDGPAWPVHPAARINETIAYRPSPPAAAAAEQIFFKQNETFPVHATDSAPHTETSAPLIIRFQIATVRERQEGGVVATTATTTGSSEVALATLVPSLVAPASMDPPAVVKASEASKGRWTLIWMGSAMAAVAIFMSSC